MKTTLFIMLAASLFLNTAYAQHAASPTEKEKSVKKAESEDPDENESIEAALEHAKQKWFKLMQQPQADYFSIQKKFERYFRKHPFEGSGPKEYGTAWLKTKLFYLDAKGRVQDPPPTDWNRIP